MANNANSKNKAQNSTKAAGTNSMSSKNKAGNNAGNNASQNARNCKDSENCMDKNSYTSESDY